jgi:hypothetical protein
MENEPGNAQVEVDQGAGRDAEARAERDAQRAAGIAEALRDLAAVVVEIVKDLVYIVVRLLPYAVRGACVALPVLALATSFQPVWDAFGNDVPALLPTVVFLLLPTVYVIEQRPSWGGLAGAGVLILVIGAVLPAVGIFRYLLVVAVIAGVVISSLFQKREVQDETGFEHSHMVDRDRSVDLHRVPVDSPGAVDVAG